MRNTVLAVTAVFAAGIFTANAQTATSGEVKVNINLHKFQTLQVNDALVEINFASEEDYMNGASSDVQDDHLTISSTNAFEVKASSVVAVQNSITTQTLGDAASPLKITATTGSTDGVEAETFANGTVLQEDALVVSSAKGQFKKNVNVQYLANTEPFINLGLLDAEGRNFISNNDDKTTYEVNVVYTITVK